MTTLTLLDMIERPSILGPDPGHRDDVHDHVRPITRAVGGAPSLDDVLTGAWEALAEGLVASCPICDGALEPRYGAGPAPVAGRCRRCGSELS